MLKLQALYIREATLKLILKSAIEVECRGCLPEFCPWNMIGCDLPLTVYPQDLTLIEKRDL